MSSEVDAVSDDTADAEAGVHAWATVSAQERTSAATTVAPSAARRSAYRWPSPRAAPVTTMTFSVKRTPVP